MKRHLQKTGVRKFFGQDLIDLQAEPLKALDSLFAEYGACIITGCEVSGAVAGTFDVAPGLVALEATDPETGVISIKTMPFDGAQGVAIPLYLTGQHTLIERVYGDGKVKPIAYSYHAVASGIAPAVPHLAITQAGNNRFVDVLQDEKHSFITASERVAWNKILSDANGYTDTRETAILSAADTKAAATLRSSKEYTDTTAVAVRSEMATADTKALRDANGYTDSRETAILAAADTKATAALRSSKEYTDTTAVAVRSEMATADTKALRDAKSYADTIVAALVSSSPEALNTLQELAAALGNDPNFATTVMNEIGKRATTKQVDDAVWAMGLSKADLHGSPTSWLDASEFYVLRTQHEFRGVIGGKFAPELPDDDVFLASWSPFGNVGLLSNTDPYFIRYGTWARHVLYHAGNVGLASGSANGFMSSADKKKLDEVSPARILVCGKVLSDGANGGQHGVAKVTPGKEWGYPTGVYRLSHLLGNTGYRTIVSLTGRKQQSLTYRIDEETDMYTIIRVHDTANYNSYADCDFNYTIMA